MIGPLKQGAYILAVDWAACYPGAPVMTQPLQVIDDKARVIQAYTCGGSQVFIPRFMVLLVDTGRDRKSWADLRRWVTIGPIDADQWALDKPIVPADWDGQRWSLEPIVEAWKMQVDLRRRRVKAAVNASLDMMADSLQVISTPIGPRVWLAPDTAVPGSAGLRTAFPRRAAP